MVHVVLQSIFWQYLTIETKETSRDGCEHALTCRCGCKVTLQLASLRRFDRDMIVGPLQTEVTEVQSMALVEYIAHLSLQVRIVVLETSTIHLLTSMTAQQPAGAVPFCGFYAHATTTKPKPTRPKTIGVGFVPAWLSVRSEQHA